MLFFGFPFPEELETERFLRAPGLSEEVEGPPLLFGGEKIKLRRALSSGVESKTGIQVLLLARVFVRA